ncbi:hypothetical protein A7Q00_05760 [Eikenella halliae]|uniref:Uncharacterized protein n=1 Tax=Eikenella halliae TaxID=1795832 RepID=A0A1B6VZ15_9NEIS|nr:hypothetical protein A7Q00_05760 [Eikenella halliae]
MPDYQVSGEKKREIGNKKQPEAWVWASAVGWRGIFAKVSHRQRSLPVFDFCYFLGILKKNIEKNSSFCIAYALKK